MPCAKFKIHARTIRGVRHRNRFAAREPDPSRAVQRADEILTRRHAAEMVSPIAMSQRDGEDLVRETLNKAWFSSWRWRWQKNDPAAVVICLDRLGLTDRLCVGRGVKPLF